jgi:hypothetical protein
MATTTAGFTAEPLGRVRNVEAALAAHGERVNLYVDAMRWGDPLADAFAAECAALPKGDGMRMLGVALRKGIDAVPDAPASLRALMAHVESIPFWLDQDQIDLGARAYSRHAREAGIALGTASLVSGYSNAAAVQPLVATARFVDEATIRALETSMWVFAVCRPGGLHRDGPGFERTVRVRMIHAFVRRYILDPPAASSFEWDEADLGLPINQADMAYAVVEFSLLPIRSIQMLGVHFSADELAGMYQMWRYMGYLIGVDERLLITNEQECLRIEDLQHLISPPPDEHSRAFTYALFDVLSANLQQASGVLGIVGKYRGRELLHGLARAFVGDEIADGLDLDDTSWKHVTRYTRPVLQVVSRLQALSPAWQDKQMRANLDEVDELLAKTAAELQITHDLVDRSDSSPTSDPVARDDKHPATV